MRFVLLASEMAGRESKRSVSQGPTPFSSPGSANASAVPTPALPFRQCRVRSNIHGICPERTPARCTCRDNPCGPRRAFGRRRGPRQSAPRLIYCPGHRHPTVHDGPAVCPGRPDFTPAIPDQDLPASAKSGRPRAERSDADTIARPSSSITVSSMPTNGHSTAIRSSRRAAAATATGRNGRT
jgi:hypothetical protein